MEVSLDPDCEVDNNIFLHRIIRIIGIMFNVFQWNSFVQPFLLTHKEEE